jgi:hypothetical protein
MDARLPETVRVKLSSEAAGAISITPVVVRDMPVRELFDFILAAIGKDAERAADLLRRGNLVSGASRLRWEGWSASRSSVEEMLATFPDAEPDRPLDRSACVRATLRAAAATVEIAREAGSRRRLFRRRSFWDVMVDTAGPSRYIEYSYRERGDRYRQPLDEAASARLRREAALITYSTLAAQVAAGGWTDIEWLSPR